MNPEQIEKRVWSIVQQEGRRPRILLAHLEIDQPDRWTKPLAAFLAEFGFDVDIGPGTQPSLQTARLAIDNDAHMIFISLVDSTNQPLVAELTEALQAEGGADIRLVAGSTGSQPDREELYRAGVDLVVNFNKPDIHMIDEMLDLLDKTGANPKPHKGS